MLSHIKISIIVFAILCTNVTLAWTQETQYLVGGYRNALPNPAAIAAAGGTWVGQIPSIGVAIARSGNPNFLTRVKKDKSVDLAGPDIEVRISEDDTAEGTLGEEAITSQFEDQVTSDALPNDPFYFLQWPHRVMEIPSAHNRGITGEGITIGVLGTGIDCSHPDLIRADGTPVVAFSISFVPRTCGAGESPPCFEDPCDVGVGTQENVDQTHETSVTGIIAAQCNNGQGVCGIAPDAEIVNVKIYGKNEQRSAPLSRILKSFDWTSTEGLSLGVRIINFSSSISCDDTDPLCKEKLIGSLGMANRMLSLVYKRGIVIFASAGNEGVDFSQTFGHFHWPAHDSPHTFPVGSTAPCCAACDGDLSNDNYDLFAAYSNHGFLPEEPFITMPGGNRPVSCFYPKPICQVGNLRLPCNAFDNVLTLTRKDVRPVPGIFGITAFNGTSAAAPHASALAALLLSRMPDLSPGQLTEAMLGTGDLGIDLTEDLGAPGYDVLFGHGRGRWF